MFEDGGVRDRGIWDFLVWSFIDSQVAHGEDDRQRMTTRFRRSLEREICSGANWHCNLGLQVWNEICDFGVLICFPIWAF